ncbi:MAG: GNAT family N-acetyltransferase [Bacteroidia bacterium]|nr:GNAT family N-acetyltransferase [Bacteroidia bacterium]
MKIFPELQSERLILGEILPRHVPEIAELVNNPKIAQMTLHIPHPYERKDAEDWIIKVRQNFENEGRYSFGIRLKSTDAFIGAMGIHPNKEYFKAELGYWIGEPYWNQGYASEALGAILKFGFEELGMNKLFAQHLIDNPASGKVMIKNGMIKEGVLIDHIKKGDEFQSLLQYRLTLAEYKSLNSQA